VYAASSSSFTPKHHTPPSWDRVSVDICRKLAFCSDNTTLMPAEAGFLHDPRDGLGVFQHPGASSIHSTV